MTQPSETEMNTLRFIEILQSYGANPDRWPASEQAEMGVFAAKFDDARTLLAEQAAIDTALDTQAAPPPSEFLRARIMSGAAPLQTSAPKPANDRLPYRAIAAMLLVGIFTGVAAAQFSPPASTADMLAQADYTDIDADYYDWLGDSAAAPGRQ